MLATLIYAMPMPKLVCVRERALDNFAQANARELLRGMTLLSEQHCAHH